MPSVENIINLMCLHILYVQTPRRQKKLFCRYHDGNRNPKFILAPAKQEDEWDKPRIIRFHDIISDAEIEIVKDLAKPRVNKFFFIHFTATVSAFVFSCKNDNMAVTTDKYCSLK